MYKTYLISTFLSEIAVQTSAQLDMLDAPTGTVHTLNQS